MKSWAIITLAFSTAAAIALVVAGTAAAVGVNCVKPLDLVSPNQDLSGCNMKGVTIGPSGDSNDLHGSNLSGANLKGVTIGVGTASETLEDSNLNGANLSGVTVGGIGTFDSATFLAANLSGATVEPNDNFVAANLSGANLNKINIVAGSFSDAFQFTIMTGANLIGATIAGDGAFDYADLTNADLTGATVTGAGDFFNATYNNTTCPDGTNSNNDGGTCVGHGI